MTDTQDPQAEKAAAFELGMHATLKEAGCNSGEEAAEFFKVAQAIIEEAQPEKK
jgi:hypothetical protein